MSSTSTRSGGLMTAVVAGLLDVVVLILALQAGAVVPALLAIVAGIVCVAGGLTAANRTAAVDSARAKQLELANSQVSGLTQQLNEVADYLSHVGRNAGRDESQETLNAATS